MSAVAAGASDGDITARDLLSSLTALQGLAMVMTDSRGEDEILDLALSALPSLSRHCRAEAVWLDGAWRSVERLRGRVGPRAGLEEQIVDLGSAGGVLDFPGLSWARAFPLTSGGDVSGYLVVGAPEQPPEHERTLIQALAQQTGVALGNARLLRREQATRARIADEQATLRRVAALVARAAPPEDVFTAVAAEAGRLRDADFAVMSRYDTDGSVTVVGAWSTDDAAHPLPVGARLGHGGNDTHTAVFRTGRPARIEDFGDAGSGADIARQWGVRSVVGVPIHIEGRLWGLIGLASTRDVLAADTETWLAGFTELVATAIANAQARVELRGIAEEQAALRRVATLVARDSSPDELFAAVAAEVGRLLDVDFTILSRYEPDGATTVVGGWAGSEADSRFAAGSGVELGGRNIHTLVFRTREPARMDFHAGASDPGAADGHDLTFRSAVGVPINVEGRLWGTISVASDRDDPLPPDTQARLVGFTELIGTALANAEAQAALTASRARIVTAADTARHRIERDLHDGAQQRLVSLVLQLRVIKEAVPPAAGALEAQLDGLADGLTDALEDLQEFARGIHPAALARGGLPTALGALARRSALPVTLDVVLDSRLPEAVELAAYYVVAEALTNAAKHADASVVDVHVSVSHGVLHVAVRDDGRGGADLTRGSGLVGLADRVDALGGSIALRSPLGEGTSLEIALPLVPRPAMPPGLA